MSKLSKRALGRKALRKARLRVASGSDYRRDPKTGASIPRDNTEARVAAEASRIFRRLVKRSRD